VGIEIDFHKALENAVSNAIKAEIQKAVEQEVEQAVKNVTRRVRESVDVIVLRVMSSYSCERFGNDLMIRVRKEI
jgi:23S rRNA G2445 N2-methylase RlmL